MAIPAQATSDLLIGRYRVLERLASGGMGVIYKAFDLKLQRSVALKFVSPQHVSDPSERDRLLREARAASALEHENIAAIHGIGETEDGQLFIDMGLYDGEDLGTRIRHAPPLRDESLDIISQVAHGLAHAHRHNVIHRDIKPSNIILTREGVAKIVDFGLARLLTPDASTVSVDFAGTLAYMSPEQVRGKSLDSRTDIWSLGAVLYELLTGRQPFRGGGTASVLNAILNSNPPDSPGVSPEARAVILKAMQKDPAKRYQLVEDFLGDIEKLQGKSMPSLKIDFGRRARLWFRNTPILRWIFAAIVVVAVIIFYPPRVNDYGRAPIAAPAANELYEQGIALLERYDRPANLETAIQRFQQTLTKDPSFALAYSALGEAYIDKYRQDQDPASLKKAEEYCKNAMRLNPSLADVHVNMGRIHDLSGQHDLALQEIQRALQLDPNNVRAMLAQGDAFSRVSRNEEAESAYRRAIAIRERNWDAHQRLGSFFFTQHRFDEAAAEYRKVLEITPDNARAHSNLAAVLLSLKRYEDAEAEMKEALRLGPGYATYFNLAYLYYTQERYRESASMAEKAVALNPNDYRTWQMLGIAYEWIGDSKNARKAYGEELIALERVAKLKAEDAEAQAELGLLHSKLARRTEAMSHLNTALALQPDNAYVLSLAGEIFENFNERNQAILYTERAILKGWEMDRMKHNPDLRAFLADPQVQQRLRTASDMYKNKSTN